MISFIDISKGKEGDSKSVGGRKRAGDDGSPVPEADGTSLPN